MIICATEPHCGFGKYAFLHRANFPNAIPQRECRYLVFSQWMIFHFFQSFRQCLQSSHLHRLVMTARTYSRMLRAISMKLTKALSHPLMTPTWVGWLNKVDLCTLEGWSSSGRSWIKDEEDGSMMMDKRSGHVDDNSWKQIFAFNNMSVSLSDCMKIAQKKSRQNRMLLDK